MFDKYRKTLVAGTVAITLGLSASGVMAAGFKPAPPAGQLGAIIVDPYGNAPLTALVDLDSHVISDVKVTVHGKGEKGVDISYKVGNESLKTYDGVPIFGLYQKFANKVTVEWKENGKAMKDDYVVQTSAIVNNYMDNRSISDLQQTKVVKVAPGFEDRLYLVNTHTFTAQGLKWSTKTGHRVRVFSSIDFPIRLVVTHHYIRAVLVRCNIQRYSPLLRELHR